MRNIVVSIVDKQRIVNIAVCIGSKQTVHTVYGIISAYHILGQSLDVILVVVSIKICNVIVVSVEAVRCRTSSSIDTQLVNTVLQACQSLVNISLGIPNLTRCHYTFHGTCCKS